METECFKSALPFYFFPNTAFLQALTTRNLTAFFVRSLSKELLTIKNTCRRRRVVVGEYEAGILEYR
jgi:hypothetical protein